jgi:hypothetical protein
VIPLAIPVRVRDDKDFEGRGRMRLRHAAKSGELRLRRPSCSSR